MKSKIKLAFEKCKKKIDLLLLPIQWQEITLKKIL